MSTRTTSLILLIIAIGLSSTLQGSAPFKIAKMDSPDHILIMRIVEKAYQRLGIPIVFIQFPGKRAILQSNSGVVDAELSRILEVGDEYPSLIRIPTPMYWFDATVFTKHQKITANDWESLRKYRIGIMRGMVFAEKRLKDFPNIEVSDNPISLFKLLNHDRVDIVIFSDVNGNYLIKKEKLNQIHALSPSLERIYAYHYVNEKHKNLVPKIDAIFQEMKRNDELDAMRDEFIKKFSK